MNGSITTAIAPAAAASMAITRIQSRVYLHACRHDPVTQNPAIGTMANMQSA